ncbi:MAG TPA: hypothetical protein VLA89_06955 [Gemmatimonadales bacterium]|nr:hypothetical protein [Gemmatimonadales bacterium]
MLRVTTASGSTYRFDNDALTWQRENNNPGHIDILFMEGVNGGSLASPVAPIVGERLTFFLPGDDWVVTTPVVSFEEV